MKPTHQTRHTTPQWSKEQIRAARMAAIAPLLEKRRLQLADTGAGNHTVREYPGLIIKDSYWRWPERDMGGNAIDLCMQVLRLDFNAAMQELTQPPAAQASAKTPQPS